MDACDLVRRWRQIGDPQRADAMLAYAEALASRASAELRGDLRAQVQP